MSPTAFMFGVLLTAFHIFCAVNAGNSYLSHYTFSPPATPSHCYQNITKCHSMNTSTCLDVILPYKLTYPPINWSAIDTNDEQQVLTQFTSIHTFLSQWNGLRVIPQCWKALQSVLCTSFFPRCEEKTQRVSLPVPEMCKVIRGPCRLIDKHFHWPSFLKCDDETLFPQGCPNAYEDLRFAVQDKQPIQRCQQPLVNTEDRNIWYPGIDGCALGCDRDIFYKEAQQLQISRLIYYGSIASILITAFACATFAINWQRSNKFPQASIFWLNASLLVASLGFIPQLFKGRTELTCRADNTARYGESEIGSSCVVSYIFIYFGTVSAFCWYMINSISCYISYNSNGESSREKQKPTLYYVFSFIIPSLMTLINLMVGQIDAEPVYGICFVGLVNTTWRILMVFFPFAICATAGTYLNIRSIHRLLQVVKTLRKQNENLSKPSAQVKCSKVKTIILRLVYTQIYVIVAFLGIGVISYMQSRSKEEHLQQLDSYVICNLNITDPKILTPKSLEAKALKQMERDKPWELMRGDSNSCRMLLPQPEMNLIYLQFFLYFLASVIACSWIFTRSTAELWKQFFREGFVASFKNQKKTKKSKKEVNGKNRATDQENGQKNAVSGTGQYWPNNTAADQSSQGFLERAELAYHHGRIPSSRRRYNDPAEMDINSITTAASQTSWASFKDTLNTFFRGKSPHLLNKSGFDSTNAGRAVLPGVYQNGTPKPIGPSSISQVVKFQNDHSASDSLPQPESVQNSTATEPVGMTAPPQDKRNKNSKRRNKTQRRGSDTSGSMLWNSKFQLKKNTATTTTSTSTGDLPATVQDNINQSPLQMAALPFQQQMNQLQQQINPMAAFHHHSQMAPIIRPQFSSPQSSLYLPNPIYPQPIRPRLPLGHNLNAKSENSFTFTHGMSDQTANQLVNPFEQIRRPISSMQTSSPSTSKSVGLSPTIQQGNFSLQTMSANQSMMMTPRPMGSNQFPGPYGQFPVMYPNMPFGSGSPYVMPGGMFPNPTIMTARGCLEYNTDVALMIQRQHMSQADIQALEKEREAFASLIQGRPDAETKCESRASSTSMVPIVISDSEADTASLVSIDARSRKSSSTKKTLRQDLQKTAEQLKDEVDNRMKEVVKQAENDAQQTENGDSIDSQFNSDSVPATSKSEK